MKIFRTALAVFMLGAASAPAAFAREINSNPAKQDAVSFHGGDPTCYSAGYVSGCEVAVDVTGNFLPTVTNTQTLGTSSLLFSNVYANASTIGAVGTANATGTGNATAPTSQTVVGGLILSPSTVGTNPGGASFAIFGSTTIPYISSYETLLASAAAVIVTAVPSISTRAVSGTGALLPTGSYLVLTSTSANTITLQSQGTLSGSGLRLGAATRVITVGNTLTLIWNATVGQWFEQSFTAGTGN